MDRKPGCATVWLIAVQATLVVLKVTGLLEWSWWRILFPTTLTVIVLVSLMGMIALYIFIDVYMERRKT